ncbi:hypothetical protein HK102_006801, partial [Quaeritorhiza haematococci]
MTSVYGDDVGHGVDADGSSITADCGVDGSDHEVGMSGVVGSSTMSEVEVVTASGSQTGDHTPNRSRDPSLRTVDADSWNSNTGRKLKKRKSFVAAVLNIFSPKGKYQDKYGSVKSKSSKKSLRGGGVSETSTVETPYGSHSGVGSSYGGGYMDSHLTVSTVRTGVSSRITEGESSKAGRQHTKYTSTFRGWASVIKSLRSDKSKSSRKAEKLAQNANSGNAGTVSPSRDGRYSNDPHRAGPSAASVPDQTHHHHHPDDLIDVAVQTVPSIQLETTHILLQPPHSSTNEHSMESFITNLRPTGLSTRSDNGLQYGRRPIPISSIIDPHFFLPPSTTELSAPALANTTNHLSVNYEPQWTKVARRRSTGLLVVDTDPKRLSAVVTSKLAEGSQPTVLSNTEINNTNNNEHTDMDTVDDAHGSSAVMPTPSSSNSDSDAVVGVGHAMMPKTPPPSPALENASNGLSEVVKQSGRFTVIRHHSNPHHHTTSKRFQLERRRNTSSASGASSLGLGLGLRTNSKDGGSGTGTDSTSTSALGGDGIGNESPRFACMVDDQESTVSSFSQILAQQEELQEMQMQGQTYPYHQY